MNVAYIFVFIFTWSHSIKISTNQSPKHINMSTIGAMDAMDTMDTEDAMITMNANGKLIGSDEKTLIKKYGHPEKELTQPRYKFIGEENIEIERTYLSTNPEFRNVLIKKSTWHIRKDLNLTGWLHYRNGAWIVICYTFSPPESIS